MGRTVRWLPLVGSLLLGGCLYPVHQKIDTTVCDLAARPRDLQPAFTADQGGPLAAAQAAADKPGSDRPKDSESEVPKAKPKDDGKKGDSSEPKRRPRARLDIPGELMPGGRVPAIRIPAEPDEDDPKRKEKQEARRQLLAQLFPDLPPVGDDKPYPLGPEGRPLTLADLQKLALSNSPLIKQATARVLEARGNAIQAGLPPNPTMGLEIDTFGTTGGAGYQGGFVDQVIKTANKLQLARASAACDLRSAEFDLFKAQTDLATRVRGGYFAVLVAEESIRLNAALVRFTGEVYRLQADAFRQGFGIYYEPIYLRSLAIQARAALVQARNGRTAAWKQLVANMGLAEMPPTRLAGRIDLPVPVFDYREVLARVLSRHSSLASTEATVQKATFDLELAHRTPIPDVEIKAMFQKDRTGAPYEIAGSLSVSVPVPVWNRNQGGILQATGALVRANEEAHRVRSELSNTLAEAFGRYNTNRTNLSLYRDYVLPDLVRVYRATYQRWREDPGPAPAGVSSPPGISDIVVAQQNLATAVGTYITTLGQQWQAVVDVTDLLQTPDLFGVEGPKQAVAEIPDLDKLCGLPCCHPCSPIPNLHHRVLDGDWPPAMPASPPTRSLPQTLPPPKPVDREGDRKKEKSPTSKKTTPVPGVDPLLLEPPPPLPGKR
jgi:cobalt-zinc-cadmium efflux system outer membrane protein